MKQTQSHFKSLCIKDITNNINESEKKELMNLLSENEINKMEYNKLKETWNYASPNKLTYEISEEQEWNKINSAIAEKDFSVKQKQNPVSKFFGSLLEPKLQNVFAFGSAAIVIIAALFLFNSSNKDLILKTINTNNFFDFSLHK